MSIVNARIAAAVKEQQNRLRSPEILVYAAAVVTGSVCIVVACLNQPYNQNELQQMAPYDTTDVHRIVNATRQPPLDPLLGAAVQHLVGTGQLRQRLVPGVAGILILVVSALLLRRLRLGPAGVVAMWATATAPLLLRYSAYTRPYALPLLLMIGYVYAAERFADQRSIRWLLLLVACGFTMPATRVPEPNVFLAVVLVMTSWRAWRGQWDRRLAAPLIVVPALALPLVGYPQFHSLQSKTGPIFDPSPRGILDRFPAGIHEVVHGFLPLMSQYTPWWPLCIVATVGVLAIPKSRAQLFGLWYFWPLLIAPSVFVFAYHFMSPFAFGVRPYHARLAIFFVPVFTLGVAALVTGLIDLVRHRHAWAGRAVMVAAAVLVATQIPASARVMTENEAPDYGQVADILTHDVPDDAVVLYDSLGSAGRWRQGFSARPRYMGNTPYVIEVSKIPLHAEQLPNHGPVYVLLLDSRCASSAVCGGTRAPWDGRVEGWRAVAQFDRFGLYQSTQGLEGRHGVLRTVSEWADDITPEYGYPYTFAAAALLKHSGQSEQGRHLITAMYAALDDNAERAIKKQAMRNGLNPFA